MKKIYLLFALVFLSDIVVSAQCTLPIPTGFKGSNITNCSVDLTWKAVSGASNYKVQYRVTGAASWNESSAITGVSVTITGLISNAPYEFEVAAYCANGTGSG